MHSREAACSYPNTYIHRMWVRAPTTYIHSAVLRAQPAHGMRARIRTHAPRACTHTHICVCVAGYARYLGGVAPPVGSLSCPEVGYCPDADAGPQTMMLADLGPRCMPTMPFSVVPTVALR